MNIQHRVHATTASLVVYECIVFALFLFLVPHIVSETVVDSELFGYAFFGVFGVMPILLYVHYVQKLEKKLWQHLALRYGFTYASKPYFQEYALMFKEGHSRATSNALLGTIHDRAFRIFQYQYTIGSGKTRRTYKYCVSEVVFSGTFPHIYLNNTRNRDLSGLNGFFLPKVPLPAAFDGKFKLHTPEGYEVEALEIFTPDVLLHILESDWQHDIELVDQKLYVFREKPIYSEADLEEEIEHLRQLVALLSPTLNRMKLAPIGDLPTTL
ncbi:MAG: hypothetical protein HYT30_01525 [Parcubacteria group bacterium]|nr:hypothetical protein [Parcubacteria group bacterium]